MRRKNGKNTVQYENRERQRKVKESKKHAFGHKRGALILHRLILSQMGE